MLSALDSEMDVGAGFAGFVGLLRFNMERRALTWALRSVAGWLPPCMEDMVSSTREPARCLI